VSGVRPLRRTDVPAAAALFEHVQRSGSFDPPPALATFFERTLFDAPRSDPEIGPLVYETDDGEIVGFVGASARRMRFEGRDIRVAVSGNLVAHPEHQKRGVGAVLQRSLLRGPQELTVTDGGSELVRRIWETLGGTTVHVSGITWFRLLRPFTLGARSVASRLGHEPAADVVAPVAAGLDALAARLPGVPVGAAPTSLTSRTLTGSAFVEHLPAVAGRLKLQPAEDATYIDWLLGQLGHLEELGAVVTGQPPRGAPVARLVADGGRVLGWYVYYLRPGAACRVLQVAARDADVGPVLDHLFDDARRRGGGVVYGRIEPRLLEPLRRRRCLLSFGQGRMVVHTRTPALAAAIYAGDALLTRLEGEWW
jgi:GNAT superfamily N-acetyltransferase